MFSQILPEVLVKNAGSDYLFLYIQVVLW